MPAECLSNACTYAIAAMFLVAGLFLGLGYFVGYHDGSRGRQTLGKNDDPLPDPRKFTPPKQ